MEIIKTQLEDILKFPFKEKDWFSTFGVYVIIGIIAGPIVIIITIPIIILALAVTPFLLAIFTILLFALFFIVNLYLQGYILEMINNVKQKKEAEKPKHKDINIKLKLGLDKFIISIGPIFLGLILLAISIAIILYGVFLFEETASTLAILLIVLGSFKAFFSILVLIFISTMIIPSMLYLYLNTNSIAKSYCSKNIWLIIKNMWKEFLVVYAVSIVLTMIISALGQMPCIGIFILMIGTAYTTFIIAFLVGRIFVQIDKLKLFQG